MQISNSNYYFNESPIRPTAILTTSYVPATVIGGDNQPANSLENLWKNNQLILYVSFTKGSLTSGGIKIEFSNDGSNWYQETEDDLAASTGIITEILQTRIFTASGNYRIPVKITDQFIRVSAIGTGTTTSSSMQINAIIANN